MEDIDKVVQLDLERGLWYKGINQSGYLHPSMAKALRVLVDAGDMFTSAADIAERASISTSSARKAVERLREFAGKHHVENNPGWGYRLRDFEVLEDW